MTRKKKLTEVPIESGTVSTRNGVIRKDPARALNDNGVALQRDDTLGPEAQELLTPEDEELA